MSELQLTGDLKPIDVVVDDGITIHGVEVGEGQPIVFLHGVALSVATWPYQFAGLRDRHRVIALDARGHGESKCEHPQWGVDRMASDVAQVLSRLDLRDAILVGHSMGGMITQQLCVDFPDLARERVAGVVLLSTAASISQGVPGFRQFNRRAMQPGSRAVNRVGRMPSVMPPAEYGYAIARLGLGVHPDPRHVTHTQNMIASFPTSSMAALMPQVAGFEVRHKLKNFPVPALIITGSRDLLTPPRLGKEMAKRIPKAEFEVVPGAGHMLMMERAQWLNERIETFAKTHPHSLAPASAD
jgi:pimeloyl-ACP methyl ester carboxylesterase